MTRAALYCRVSTDRQANEGDSIPAQLQALHSFADKHGYEVVGEYIDDGISGMKNDRDELNRLLSDLEQIDMILFTKLDRWFRSVRHYLNTQEILDKHGVTWKAIWENYETESPGGRFVISTMMAIAQLEAENTGSRVRQVFQYKVSQGEVISGSVPPGYRIEDKHLVIVPDEAESVRFAFEEYARTGSIRNTVAACTALPGLPTVMGTFRNMLKNRMYLGEYRGNPNYCEPIISRELFEEVQRNLSMNVKPTQKHPYLFSGLIVCAECGRKIHGNQRRYRNNKPVYVYRCQKRYYRPDPCSNQKVLQENLLEKELLSRIRPELEGIVFELEEKQKKQRKKVDIKGKLDRLKDLYINGMIDLDEYRRDREKLEALSEPPEVHNLDQIRKVLSTDFESLYASFTPLQKRRFWRLLIKEIKWTADRQVIIEWY